MNRQKVVSSIGALLLAASGWVAAAQQPAQQEGLPAPSPIEKELAARASDVTEVTLGKDMLGFASKFMNGKNGDDVATRKLIDGLKGIYVREYEFDKEGEYTAEQVDALRKHFETAEWTPVVRVRERKSRENTDVLMKMVNGETQGLFVLDAEPRELTIVLILGPIRMEDLGKLSGLSGLSGINGIHGDEPKLQTRKAGQP